MKDNTNSKSIPYMLLVLSVFCVSALITSVILQTYLINFGFTYISATTFTFPFMAICLDIMAELYGYQTARFMLWTVIIAVTLFAIVITFFIHLSSPPFWRIYTDDFHIALSPVLRTACVGDFAMLIGQYTNIYLITKFRIMTNGRFFVLRSISSTVIGDTITVTLALLGNYLGRTSLAHMGVIIVSELIIMYVLALILAGPAKLIVSIMHKKGVSMANQFVAFNPFAKDNS